MNTAHGPTGWGQATVSTWPAFGFFERYWNTFQERRKRERLRADLCDLSDRELMDIGTTRGEIDYVASMRLMRGDVRDHIDSSKIDHGPP